MGGYKFQCGHVGGSRCRTCVDAEIRRLCVLLQGGVEYLADDNSEPARFWKADAEAEIAAALGTEAP